MKIGKITFDGYNNYGNTLQNYALQEYLKKFGADVETIWHSPHERLSEFWKWGAKEEVKFLINHGAFKKNVKSGIRAWEFARRVRGMDFSQRYINIRYDVEDLKSIAHEYDFFVVGSDQVWNPNNPDLQTAFLEFAPSHKRISFAASMGVRFVPDELKEEFKIGLNAMHSISVRESRASEIIFELTGKTVEVLLDPVFCLPESKWRDMSIRPYWLKKGAYIFSYFLGDTPDFVYETARSEGLEIIKCFDRESLDRYIMSPEEWLYLLGNAKYVFTDSFHASAFSIIFKRNFMVFPRGGNSENNQMITRIESLLHTFSMEDRFSEKKVVMRDENVCNHIDDIMKKEVAKSERFIKESLLINEQ